MEVKGDLIVHGNYIENQTINVQGDLHMGMPEGGYSTFLPAIDAIATEVAVVDGGLADYVRIPARQEEILSALHANIDGKKGRAVALVITCAIEEGLLNRPPFPVLEREFGDIGSAQSYSKAINLGFTEVEKRRFKKVFTALTS